MLVVEDHSTYRALMGWLLQKLGIDHVLVANGRSALAAIACREFDLVISDCQMPLMDGYALAREIRRRERDEGRARVPIIILTAHLPADAPQRCCDAGIDAWLLKPLTFEQLREALTRWLPGSPALPRRNDCVVQRATWPTRASLLETFGSTHVVNQMLESLLCEAHEDSAVLAYACQACNGDLAAQQLHRLVGSLAFLGDADLELRGGALIEQVRARGVEPNKQQLETFEGDLRIYLNYLHDL
ncbi:response regulator [Pseudomonas poae]|uniref:Response regulator n=1 Tax=Pseudomonas poae TaxID=200451 RepID=A0A2S9EW66_9PSED|nr:response regulator [Pseudomonas poae]PRC20629.1 response regulator [Pseudomonas poae]